MSLVYSAIGGHINTVETWSPLKSLEAVTFKYIDLGAVDKEKKEVCIENVQNVLSSDAPSRARQLTQTNDILISTVRPNLNGVALVPEELDGATVSTGYCVLRVNEKTLNSKYLRYWVESSFFVSDMVKKATGANYPAVSDKIIRESKIPLPPLETQKQIAAILEKADQLRKDCQQMEQELNSLAQSVFIDMFGGIKDKEPLSKHLRFITSGSRGWAKYYSNCGRRFIRSLDVRMNHIGKADIAYVQPPKSKEAERTKVEEGDVLITITGSRIGRVSSIPPGFGDAHISQHVALLRLKETLLPEFLSFYMSLDGYGQRQITKSQYGQTKPGLKLDHIREFVVPKLGVEEQQKFVDYMSQLTLIVSDNKQQQRELHMGFNALMQKAFKGELNLNKAAA